MEDCPNYLSTEEIVKIFHQSAAKTPYQLDLEVKDRKPNIVPKVGDKVKIKSKEWYEKWKENICGDVGISINGWLFDFVKPMSDWCGKIMEVKRVDSDGAIKLEGSNFWWHPKFLEEVYPQESESTGVHIVKLGGKLIDLKVSKLNDPKDSKLKMINKNQYIKLKKL